MTMIPQYDDLNAFTDDDLIANYNDLTPRVEGSVNFYLGELFRRQQKRQAGEMAKLTAKMLWLTIAIAVLTVANVGLEVFRAIHGGAY